MTAELTCGTLWGMKTNKDLLKTINEVKLALDLMLGQDNSVQRIAVCNAVINTMKEMKLQASCQALMEVKTPE